MFFKCRMMRLFVSEKRCIYLWNFHHIINLDLCTYKKISFCTVRFRNSLILPAWTQVRGVSTDAEALRVIRRLESGSYECNLFYPVLIRGSFITGLYK